MIHVIDANNLAGKLDLLKQKDFDRQLTEIVKEFYAEKKIQVFLVFDSLDPMGDKIRSGYLTIVYTPRDSHYSSADDMIIELVEATTKRQVRVITDDLEIIEKVEEIGEGSDKDIQILKATKFAKQLEFGIERNEIEKGDYEDEELNEELLKAWQAKE